MILVVSDDDLERYRYLHSHHNLERSRPISAWLNKTRLITRQFNRLFSALIQSSIKPYSPSELLIKGLINPLYERSSNSLVTFTMNLISYIDQSGEPVKRLVEPGAASINNNSYKRAKSNRNTKHSSQLLINNGYQIPLFPSKYPPKNPIYKLNNINQSPHPPIKSPNSLNRAPPNPLKIPPTLIPPKNINKTPPHNHPPKIRTATNPAHPKK